MLTNVTRLTLAAVFGLALTLSLTPTAQARGSGHGGHKGGHGGHGHHHANHRGNHAHAHAGGRAAAFARAGVGGRGYRGGWGTGWGGWNTGWGGWYTPWWTGTGTTYYSNGSTTVPVPYPVVTPAQNTVVPVPVAAPNAPSGPSK